MIIITGASDNHFNTLSQFLTNIKECNKEQIAEKIIVYNLGLNSNNWNLLKEQFTESYFLFEIFKYENYPEWYNININAGEYAWKSAIIKECSLKYENNILVWMDSGNLINVPIALSNLKKVVDYEGIHTVKTSGNISLWTHKGTIDYLNANHLINNENRNGACIGFNLKKDWVKEFLNEYSNFCSIKKCIAPEGSSRKNHRQDQSILTILYYKYKEKIQFKTHPGYQEKTVNEFYSVHNDID